MKFFVKTLLLTLLALPTGILFAVEYNPEDVARYHLIKRQLDQSDPHPGPFFGAEALDPQTISRIIAERIVPTPHVLNVKDHEGNTLLHHFCKLPCPGALRLVLQLYRQLDLEHPYPKGFFLNNSGESPLFYSTRTSDSVFSMRRFAMKELLAKDPLQQSYNGIPSTNGTFPLELEDCFHQVSNKTSLNAFRADLLEASVDYIQSLPEPEIKYLQGKLLRYAIRKKMLPFVYTLINQGYNVNDQNAEGKTLLDYAIEQGDAETVELLRQAEALRSTAPSTPLSNF